MITKKACHFIKESLTMEYDFQKMRHTLHLEKDKLLKEIYYSVFVHR